MKKLLYLFSIIIVIPITSVNAKVSPIDFGLLQAKTGVEKYRILLFTHQTALKYGTDVDYTGIKNIDIEIPVDAKSIPLTRKNDFNNIVLNVTNNSKDIILFTTDYLLEPIVVTGNMVKKRRYSVLKELSRHSPVLLIVEDKEPWIQTREAYKYGVMRKEALLIKNGRSVFQTIGSYDNDTEVSAYYRLVDNLGTEICNLTFNRTKDSTKKTFLFKVENENNVRINNIVAYTPPSKLTGDVLMAVNNSTNVTFRGVSINNTYSTYNEFGYGINMNNVTNATFEHLYANGNWGVFGTYSVNTVCLKECNLNRFDIHCYGRDVRCENCTFHDLYNQFSSFYGSLYYKSCTFKDFIPVSIEMSFNAYTGFDVFFEDCILSTTNRNHELINVGRLDDQISPRVQLKEKCWPNVTIKNLMVYAEYGSNPLYLYRVRGDITYPVPVGYLSSISIDGLTYQLSEDAHPIKDIYICSAKILTSNNLKISLKNIDLSLKDSKKGNIEIMLRGVSQNDKIKTRKLNSHLKKVEL